MRPRRCLFQAYGMKCVLEECHPIEQIFGGHFLVADRYVDDSDVAWSEREIAEFRAQYPEESEQ